MQPVSEQLKHCMRAAVEDTPLLRSLSMGPAAAGTLI